MTLTNREKILVTTLALVLALGLFVYFIVFPMVDKIKVNYAILYEDRITLSNLEEANRTGALTDEEKSIQDQIMAIEERLPTQVRIPEMFLEILHISDNIGLSQEGFTMLSTIIEDGRAKISDNPEGNSDESSKISQLEEKLLILPVNHIFKGSYEQIKAYIYDIQNCKRRMDIVEYQLSRNKESNNLSANFVLHAYGLVQDNQNYSEYVDYDFIKGSYGRENPFSTSDSFMEEESDIAEETVN